MTKKTILPAYRGVLVYMPIELLDRLNNKSKALNMSRSDVIREALTEATADGFIGKTGKLHNIEENQ